MTGSVVVGISPDEKEAYAKLADGSFKNPFAAIEHKMTEAHSMVQGDVMSIQRDPDLAHGQSSLCFRNLSFSYKSRADGLEKIIVTPTSGAYAAGTMVAVMVRGSAFRGRGDAPTRILPSFPSPPKTRPTHYTTAPLGRRPSFSHEQTHKLPTVLTNAPMTRTKSVPKKKKKKQKRCVDLFSLSAKGFMRGCAERDTQAAGTLAAGTQRMW